MKKRKHENAHAPPEQTLREALEACRHERDEYLGGWKRAHADYSNARKEMERERQEAIKFSEETLIKEMLEVLDTFDEALRQAPENEGMRNTHRKLLHVLTSHGLSVRNVSPGDTFDHTLHEAVAGSGDVVDVVAGQAYYLHDKLVRPAKVIVKVPHTN